MTRIGVAGAGAWRHRSRGRRERAGSHPVLWSRRGAFETPGFSVSGDDHIVADVDMLCSRYRRRIWVASPCALHPALAAGLPLVICAKGIARPGNRLLSDVVREAAPGRPIAILSGPTFASEVLRGQPTAFTIGER